MPICGDTCSIGLSSLMYEGHKFTIELGSNEIDVRVFGSGDYGSWIACNKSGSISLDSYARPNVDVGDTLTFTASCGTETFSIPVIVTAQTINADSKDLVNYTTNMRINGTVTIA